MRPLPRAVAMLPALAVILVACGGTPQGTPTASPSETPMASDGPSATPSVMPTDAETEPPSASPTPATALAIDTVVQTTVNGLRLREEPTTGAMSLGTLSTGAQSYVIDGPVASDGYSWYLLAGLGLPQYSGCSGPIPTDPWECPVWFGWAAAASPEGDAWLEADDLDCPPWPEDVDFDITLGVQRVAYLACFGDEERALTGFYPTIPDDVELGGACSSVPEGLSWIACNLGSEHVVPDETGQFGTGFVFSVDPDTVVMPDRGQWIRLTGRFDHSAAQQCTFEDPPSRSVLQCRAQFVVESAEAMPAPTP